MAKKTPERWWVLRNDYGFDAPQVWWGKRPTKTYGMFQVGRHTKFIGYVPYWLGLELGLEPGQCVEIERPVIRVKKTTAKR